MVLKIEPQAADILHRETSPACEPKNKYYFSVALRLV